MKNLILIIFTTLTFLGANAQIFQGDVASHAGSNSYDQAIGLRLGFDLGATYKVNLAGNSYAELLALFNDGDIKAAALYELHYGISSGFNWYWGLGATAEIGGGFAIGATPVIGVEFNFGDFPFNASLDYMPTWRLIKINEEDNSFVGDNVALSIRYVIN